MLGFAARYPACAGCFPSPKSVNVTASVSAKTLMPLTSNWVFWALLSAVFAALTAIFAKAGVENIDSDLATLIRTVVILIVLAGFVYFAGKW
ncbi:MAG: hypothetical protein FWF20_04720, partial [Betaproteobacteria bacterium]|nr:hypothetical protein [Betaproteobacteria bacterium]